MGGFGSSRWNGRRVRRTVESCTAFDIGWLVKDREFQLGVNSEGTLSWRKNGEPYATVGFYYAYDRDTEAEYLTFIYTANGEPVDLRIPLRRTPAHFGGERLWLTCPLCHRYERLSKLYIHSRTKYFACRHCHKLAYRSTHRTNYGPARLMRFIGRMQMRFALQDGKCRS